jgi:hypothetical protein
MERPTIKESQVYWLSPLKDECQLCYSPFSNTMYDVCVRYGQWGNICQTCFDQPLNHCGLGLGRGQKYELQPNGRWLKTEG